MTALSYGPGARRGPAITLALGAAPDTVRPAEASAGATAPVLLSVGGTQVELHHREAEALADALRRMAGLTRDGWSQSAPVLPPLRNSPLPVDEMTEWLGWADQNAQGIEAPSPAASRPTPLTAAQLAAAARPPR